MCRKLGVSRSGYYDWRDRSKSAQQVDNEDLLREVVRIHREKQERYGYPRMHKELNRRGVPCGRNRVAGIMRDYGIKARAARRFRRHSHRHHLFRESTNLLLDQPPPTRANQVWVCDVTYIRINRDWSYLCVIMDLHTRRIVGWHFSTDRNADLVREAILMALLDHTPAEDAIFHTDQGIEFANKNIRDLVLKSGLRVSMSRRGYCWDNASMESFFHSLKTEMVYFHHFESLTEATAYIIDYMYFYNHQRLHSGIGYVTPEEYNALAA
jgi:putative transposase